MLDKSLKFNSINVIRAPGFNPPGFSVKGLKPQINIIYGPNAAGKTTMARAFSYLIWPEYSPENAFVQGKFTFNNVEWFAEIDAGKVIYQKDGSSSSPPLFPPGEHRDRYYIALHDLLQQESNNRSFAEIIIRESAGGYQILDAVKKLGLKDKPSPRGKTTRKTLKMIKNYQQAVKKQEDLLAEERKLEGLKKELKDIKKAQKRLEMVKQALEYARVDEQYKEIKAKLDQFSQVMKNISGDEEESLNKLSEDIRIHENKKINSVKKIESAERVLKEVDLPVEGVSEGFITEIKDRNDDLKTRENRIDRLQVELNEMKTKKEEEKANIIGLVKEDKLSEINGSAYNELNRFAFKAEKVHNKLSALHYLKKLIKPEEKNPADEDILKEGIRFLEDWLSTPEVRTEQKKIKTISLLSSLVILSMLIFMGYVVDPLIFLLIIIPGGILWYGYSLDGRHNYKTDARKKFEQLDLEGDINWDRPSVRTYLQKLYNLLVKVKLIKRRKQYWEDKNTEYEKLKKTEAELNRERNQLNQKYGVTPDTDEQTLYYLTNRLSRWQDAHSNMLAIKSKLQKNIKKYTKLMAVVNKKLAGYGYSKADDTAKLSSNITDLEARNSRFQKAVRDRREAEDNKKEADNVLQKARKKMKEIYSSLQLEPGNKVELRKLINKYDDYNEIKEKLTKVEHQRRVEKIRLKEYNSFHKSIPGKDKVELKQILNKLLEKSGRYSTVVDKISSIKTRINTAREGKSVEEAYIRRERNLDLLQGELEDDYEKLAGKVLADHIRDVNTEQNRPAVFRRAQQLFRDITRGNYELTISKSKIPTFRAFETITGKGKSLDELSSGTRIQLLMAVRMAFIDKEEGILLPLYLDETLANADDSKAEAIVKTVIELARRGRQCFYFTAQMDEVKRWLAIIKSDSKLEYNIVDLGKSENNKSISLPDFNNLKLDSEQLPDVNDLSHKDYKEKISVPDFNPQKGAGSAHIWYIVEDPHLVRHFLALGIKRWGQLKTLLATKKDGFIPEGKRKLINEIKQLGRCLEEFADCWKEGRARKVDRSVLLSSGAVSSNFIDEVTELSQNLNGDGKLLIRELRRGTVSRFLTKKVDELEQYFQKHNYINHKDKLTAEQIHARMLSVINFDKTGYLVNKINGLINRLT